MDTEGDTVSRSADRLVRRNRHACRCGHRALFFRGGRPGPAVRARRDHTLCLRCWRAALSRELAHQMGLARRLRLAGVPGPFALL